MIEDTGLEESGKSTQRPPPASLTTAVQIRRSSPLAPCLAPR